MAGDWIKVRVDLITSPKVVRIASQLKTDRFRTVGGLLSVWCLFDTHTEDGVLQNYTPELLDEMIGWPGFAGAMISAGWLENVDNSLVMPRFCSHNGKPAKKRAEDAERKRRARAAPPVPELSANCPAKTETRGEESRGEESNNNTPPQTNNNLPAETSSQITLDWIPSGSLFAEVAANLGVKELDLWPHVQTFAAHYNGQKLNGLAGRFQKWCAKGIEFARNDRRG